MISRPPWSTLAGANSSMRALVGININDASQPYTDQILAGSKTVETRATRSLDAYVGRRVGIVRTGRGRATLVAYATIGAPVHYPTVAEFDADYPRHLVGPSSPHYWTEAGKYGYPLTAVRRVRPRQIHTLGIVARRIAAG